MKPKISEKARKFKRSVSPVRQIMSYADADYIRGIGIDPAELISFAGGWVNHKAPEELRESYLDIAADEDLFHHSGKYPPTLGTPETKQAIIDFEKCLYKMEDLDPSQVAVGMGSTQLAIDLFQILLDPGDRFLLLDPSYCNYPVQILTALMDIRILRFPVLDTQSWKYLAEEKADEFHDFILEHRPKLILLICPDNPTSQILPGKFVRSALEAAREIGAFLVIDFAYKEIVFTEESPPYFSWGPNDNFISLHSNSKWCRGLGRRLGWIEAPAFVIEAAESIFNSTILCSDMFHQMAFARYVGKALKENSLREYTKKMSRAYREAAELTVSCIEKHLGLPYLRPRGGLYTCLRLETDGARFVEEVLKKTGVLLVPGWGFGRTLKNGVRVSYGPLVNDPDSIKKGMEKIGAYLKSKK